ncbi:MAG: UDP-N-acetylglucosamine--N-acetylmuramyl-(pentapeptide) pyrophosphoryl-undecaprenol N-acetylglucosamine transferase, partial [Bacteroidaceae bacterium]|nr:UDP-N-acetylglucosamine--N-acetylmuramyl-(pentapeptide) pyrophosphoryl-undecaprenol N-acetylglucosamine transferase [Bacteroidaceae bacterium]
VCVAYSGMARFFPAEKILMTGNPVRQNLLDNKISKEDARESFGLAPDKKTVLIVGGSLGARTINESVLAHLEEIRKSDVQFIWQTGKYYSQHIAEELSKAEPVENLKVMDFISSMDNAYAAADIVVSRAGASSISELCLLGKPCILVPSPNVAEDHQTKNAMALSGRGAAILVKDKDAKDELIGVALKTVMDDLKLDSLSGNVKMMAFHNAADVIAEEVYKLAVEYKNKKN